MHLTRLNPFTWHFADDQGIAVDAPTRLVFVSGQTAMSDAGHPQHPGDMRAQVELTLDNVAAVLEAADMTLGNIVQMNTHVTDMASFLSDGAAYMGERLAGHDVSPPGVLSGVTELAAPELIVEIDAIAAA